MRGIGRRRKFRRIGKHHDEICFKPCGKRVEELQSIVLYDDELEALRLSDFESMYQQDAADAMQISRTTFSRVVAEARRKVVDALLHQKIIIKEKRKL